MKKLFLVNILACLIVVLASCNSTNSTTSDDQQVADSTAIEKEERIVSLNGAITEIICALDRGDDLVGVDVTSVYPEWIQDSVKVLGHVRTLTVEGILDLQPTVVMATTKSLNPKLKNAITQSGIKLELFDQTFSVDGTKKLVHDVEKYLAENKAEETINKKIDNALSKIQSFTTPPKVLFIYARGAGTLMVAGKDTPMSEIVKISGGEYAITEFSEFKPLTEEALLGINPDVILLFKSGLHSLSGIDGLLKTVPAISTTNAGKSKAIIAMDGAFLTNFGPRVGDAALKLNSLLQAYAK